MGAPLGLVFSQFTLSAAARVRAREKQSLTTYWTVHRACLNRTERRTDRTVLFWCDKQADGPTHRRAYSDAWLALLRHQLPVRCYKVSSSLVAQYHHVRSLDVSPLCSLFSLIRTFLLSSRRL